jgi:CarD family transcriptional regulator
MIELEYKNLLSTGSKEDIIKVIKTAYLRNKERLQKKKKLSEKDTNYLEKAEKLLYNELSVVLNLSIDATREYIIDKVEAI